MLAARQKTSPSRARPRLVPCLCLGPCLRPTTDQLPQPAPLTRQAYHDDHCHAGTTKAPTPPCLLLCLCHGLAHMQHLKVQRTSTHIHTHSLARATHLVSAMMTSLLGATATPWGLFRAENWVALLPSPAKPPVVVVLTPARRTSDPPVVICGRCFQVGTGQEADPVKDIVGACQCQ